MRRQIASVSDILLPFGPVMRPLLSGYIWVLKVGHDMIDLVGRDEVLK